MGERFDRDGIQKRIITTVTEIDQPGRLMISVGIKGESGLGTEDIGAILVRTGFPTTSGNDWNDGIPPRIEACFDTFWDGAPATGRLKAIAERLGGDHFSFYQVIEEDSPTQAAFNQMASPPYVDPPRGGFPSSDGEDDAIWSDNIPWYHDEMLPPGDNYDPCDPVTAAGNASQDGNSIGYYDDPHFDEGTEPGTVIRFKTWVVLVKGAEAGAGEAYRPVAFLGGFRWQVTKNDDGGRTTENLDRTDTNCPTEADYEQLLNQPDVPGLPAWFDTNPADFAPYPDAG